MLASINSEFDINIFLTGQEIENLKSQILKGVIIETIAPKNQNPIELMVKQDTSVYRIEVINKPNYRVRMGLDYYEKLREMGHVGTRYGGQGSKIDIYKRSVARDEKELSFELHLLDSYLEKKGKLR